MMLGYPIYHLDGTELPETGTYYVVAGNGVFLHKDTEFMKGYVPVEFVSFLDDMPKSKLGPVWKGLKIPFPIAYKIKRFFFKVYQKYGTEACSILYFNPEKQEWAGSIPNQKVSHAYVKYEREFLSHLDGFIPIGTIHSHADFHAFHSGTDDHDEEGFDGIHITFGHNNNEAISISASIVMNGLRTMLDPLSVLEGFSKLDDRYITELPSSELIIKAEEEVANWIENNVTN